LAFAERARAARAVLKKLAASLRSCSREELSRALGGTDIFGTTMSADAGEKPPFEAARMAAAFILFCQVLICQALARETGGLPDLGQAKVRNWTELREQYFEPLRRSRFARLFAAPVAPLLDREGGPELLSITAIAARNLLPLSREYDVLGKLYHELVPHGLRKRVGAFYTNDAAAQLLASLTINASRVHVIDPACGSGALLLAAYSRLKTLYETCDRKARRDEDPIGQLTGTDLMPFAVYLAAVNLLLQGPEGQTRGIRLGVADGTQLLPGSVVLDWNGETRFHVGLHDVVLMNPPFTRGHVLAPEAKQRLLAGFSTSGTYLGGLAGLQSYFLLLADALLREGGCLGAVLPASTFGTRSNQQLTSFLLRRFTVDLVILCRRRPAFSEQTNLRELLLIAQKESPPEGHKVTFAAIDESPSLWTTADVERFRAALSSAALANQTTSIPNSGIWVHRVAQAQLSQQPRLFYRNLLQTSSRLLDAYELLQELADKAELESFPAVFRHLHVPYLLNPRGSFALGFKALNLLPNAKACLKANDVWFVAEARATSLLVRNRITNATVKLSPSDTLPCVRRIAGLTRINSSDAVGRTLHRGGTPVAEQLLTETFSEALSIKHSKTLADCWQPRVDKTRTHLVMLYKADLAALGTRVLAASFDEAAYPAGDAWIFPRLPLEEARILALWMNSSFFLVDLIVNRTEQRGSWMRFDKPVLDDLRLLDPTMLSAAKRRHLLNLYARIQRVSLPPLLSRQVQANQHMIDAGILRILGAKRADADDLAKKFASAAEEAVADLAAIMRGG
jgi:hypothetical protein